MADIIKWDNGTTTGDSGVQAQPSQIVWDNGDSSNTNQDQPLSPQHKSLATNVRDTLLGGSSFPATMGRTLWNTTAGSISKGLRTGAELLGGNDLSGALKAGDETADKISIPTTTDQGKSADEALGKAYDWTKSGLQDINNADIDLFMKSEKFQKLPDSEKLQWYRAAAKQEAVTGATTDIAGMVEPILGLKKFGKGKADVESPIDEEKPVDIKWDNQQDLPGTEHFQPSSVDVQGEHQDIQSPYNLSDEQKASIEAEIRKDQHGEQGDLFDEARPYTPEEMQGKRYVLEDGHQREIKDLPGEELHTPEAMNLQARMSEQFDMTPGNENAGVRSEGVQQLKPVGEDQQPLPYQQTSIQPQEPSPKGSYEGSVPVTDVNPQANVQRFYEQELQRQEQQKRQDAFNQPANTRTPEERLPYVPRGQRGAIGDWNQRLSKGTKQTGSVLSVMKDMKEQFQSLAGKTLNDLFRSDDRFKSPLKDMDGEFLGKTGREALFGDRAVAILSQKLGATGKFTKWVVDNRRGIDQLKETAIRRAVDEGLNHWKVGDPKVYANIRGMLDKWMDNVGKGELTRSDFKNDREWKAFQKTHDLLDKVRDRVNEVRAKYGHDPIPYLKNYLPSVFEGDYVIWGKDSLGENKAAFRFPTKWHAKYALKKLKAAHPNITFEDVKHVEKGKYDLSNLAAFEEAIRVMGKHDDPITSAIQKTMSDIRTHRGFSKTALGRSGILGAIGYEPGKVGVKNMQRGIETWIKRAESHVANLEKAGLESQIDKMPLSMRKQIPNALDWATGYLDMSRGANRDLVHGLTDGIGFLTDKILGLGQSAPKRFVQHVSSFASLAWLMKPTFFLMNTFQHLNMLPQMIKLAGIDKDVRNPIAAQMHGYNNAISATRDAGAKDFLKYLSDNNYLESAIVGMLDLRLSDVKGRLGSLLGDASRASLGKWEHYAVRVPAAMTAEWALRDSIPDAATRYKTAAEMMNHYMVDYDKSSLPPIYNHAGVIGTVMKPLKAYAHNFYGQFFEYLQHTKDHKQFAPLATFLGIQAFQAGFKGTILVTEAALIINAINAAFDTDIDIPEKWMIKHHFPDSVVYGPLSSAMGPKGVDVSGTASAPTIPSMLSAAPIQYTTQAISAAWKYATKTMNGTLDDQTKMKLAFAVAPSAAKGWIEHYFTNESGITPNPNNPNLSGSYRRTDKDTAYLGIPTWMLSVNSIPEAKANALVRSVKSDLLQDMAMKTEAIDAIADRAAHHERIDPDLVKRYIAEGGDITNLPNDIIARIKKRYTTYQEQIIQQGASGSMTNSKLNKLETLQKYTDRDVSKTITPNAPKPQVPQPQVTPEAAGSALDAIQSRYNSPKELDDRAKIRAAENNNDPVKIQSKIDAIDSQLKERKVNGTQRDLLVNEAQLLQRAKDHSKGQIKLEGLSSRDPDATEQGQYSGKFAKSITEYTKYNGAYNVYGKGERVFGANEQMSPVHGKEFITDEAKRKTKVRKTYGGIL